MTHTKIKIHHVGDPPFFPELAHKSIIECSLDRVGILQNGTEQGKTSLGLFIDLPDGRICWVQVTAGMWDMISGILRGARQSWGEPSD